MKLPGSNSAAGMPMQAGSCWHQTVQLHKSTFSSWTIPGRGAYCNKYYTNLSQWRKEECSMLPSEWPKAHQAQVSSPLASKRQEQFRASAPYTNMQPYITESHTHADGSERSQTHDKVNCTLMAR